MIRITAHRDGFRRCGIAHPSTPTEYPDDRFSKKELKQLQDETMLTVEVIKGGTIAKTGPLNKMTKADMKALLDKLEVPYDASAKLKDLLALVTKHTADPPEE
jgi:FluMu-like protein